MWCGQFSSCRYEREMGEGKAMESSGPTECTTVELHYVHDCIKPQITVHPKVLGKAGTGLSFKIIFEAKKKY